MIFWKALQKGPGLALKGLAVVPTSSTLSLGFRALRNGGSILARRLAFTCSTRKREEERVVNDADSSELMSWSCTCCPQRDFGGFFSGLVVFGMSRGGISTSRKILPPQNQVKHLDFCFWFCGFVPVPFAIELAAQVIQRWKETTHLKKEILISSSRRNIAGTCKPDEPQQVEDCNLVWNPPSSWRL